MSTRTRRSRSQVPGVASVHKPNRYQRRQEHQRVRHETNIALQTFDEPDDLTLPRPHHTAVRLEPVSRDTADTADATTPKFRVWKTKAWKRRKHARYQRALQEHQLLREA